MASFLDASKENKIIGIGSIIAIYDFEFEEKNTYRIIRGNCSNDDELSSDSVLGRTLLGKTVGDKVVIYAEFPYEIKILEVDNSNLSIKTEKAKEKEKQEYVTLTARSITPTIANNKLSAIK